MGNLTREIIIKLRINTAEVITNLDAVQAEAENLIKKMEQPGRTSLLKEFQRDLVNIGEASEDATAGIMDFIRYNNLSEDEIQDVIHALLEQKQALAMASEGHLKTSAAIENLSSAYQQLSVANAKNVRTTNQMNVASGAARQTVSQFGFALGDAGMIAVDFRMFLLSIGNNIPFVVQGLANVKTEAAAAGKSMSQYLRTQLDTGMKLVLGANAIMFAMQVLPALFSKINESSREAAEEGMKKFNKELEEMTEMDVEEKLDEIALKLAQINLHQATMSAPGGWLQALISGEMFRGEEISMYEKQLEQLNEKDKEYDEQKKRRVGALKLEIQNYENLIKRVSETEENADQKIQNLTDKKAAKQKELNELLRTTEERQKKIREEAEKQFNALDKELQAAQDHALTMVEIETDNRAIILSLKKKQLNERIGLYKKYGRDVTQLLYQLTETEARLESALKSPTINIEGEPEDIILPDLKIATREEHTEMEISLIQDRYKREYELLKLWRDRELQKYKDDAEMKLMIEKSFAQQKMELLRTELRDTSLIHNSMQAGFSTMWDTIIVGNRQAKDEWDAVWLAMRNSALYFLGEILAAELENIALSIAAHIAGEEVKTAVTAEGAAIRLTFLVEEIAKTLASAAASLLKAIASMIAWQIATFGPFALITLPASIAAIFALFNVAKSALGFEHGGRLREGETGYFEGYHNEIIAPEKTFIEVFRNELRPQIYGGIADNNSELLNELKQLNKNFRDYSDRPIEMNIGRKAAKDIVVMGNGAIRKSR